MFLDFFKSSKVALAFIVILPLAVLFLYDFKVYDFIQWHKVAEIIGYSIFTMANLWQSTIATWIVNLLMVIIIPCKFGGVNPAIKKVQFYIGLVLNLFFALLFPVLYRSVFTLDTFGAVVIIILHVVSFLATFIISALFVAPAYRNAFWFFNRNK